MTPRWNFDSTAASTLSASRDDLGADAVAGDDGDAAARGHVRGRAASAGDAELPVDLELGAAGGAAGDGEVLAAVGAEDDLPPAGQRAAAEAALARRWGCRSCGRCRWGGRGTWAVPWRKNGASARGCGPRGDATGGGGGGGAARGGWLRIVGALKCRLRPRDRCAARHRRRARCARRRIRDRWRCSDSDSRARA